MASLKYAANIVTDTREYTREELVKIDEMRSRSPVTSTVKMLRLLWMDDTKVPGANFYMECIWLWEGATTSGTTEEPHQHDFPEVIGFIGSNPERPHELDGRMEIILEDEKHCLTKSCLVFIPPGMKHCPLTFREVNRPVFFFTLAPISRYGRTAQATGPDRSMPKPSAFVPLAPDASGTRYGRYIITQPKPHWTGPRKPNPNAKTTQVVSLDDEVSPGAFYVDFVWIWSGTMTMSQPHLHDFDEMIGIIGSDRENPRAVSGDVTIKLGDELHAITQSSLIYLPKGLTHCPLQFTNIAKPVLCFTVGKAQKWEQRQA